MPRHFDQLRVCSKATKLSEERVDRLLQEHQLMLKIIWSGFGGRRHGNRHAGTGAWDMADWDYLIDQLKDPANNRPVYGQSRSGAAYNWTVMGDDRDRRIYYDVGRHAWVHRRDLEYKARGANKPGIKTIKAGHYSLLPPYGRMMYCRGIDPETGRTARSDAPFYDARQRCFPGRQIAWLFSAELVDGGVVKHCCEEDMYGRRLPWLGGERSAKYAMRNSPYGGTRLPDFINVDQLRQRQRRERRRTLKHNDCRFKATRRSVAAIMIPDDLPGDEHGLLAKLNGLQKKLYVLSAMGLDCPLVMKSQHQARFRHIAGRDCWRIVVDAAASYPALLRAMPLQLLPMSEALYADIVAYMEPTAAIRREGSARKLALGLILRSYGYTGTCVYDLHDERLLKKLVDEGACDDVIYAVVQAGGNVEDPVVLQYLVAHWSGYRAVLGADQLSRIRAIIQQQLCQLLLQGTFAVSASFVADVSAASPELAALLADALSADRQAIEAGLCRSYLVDGLPGFVLSAEQYRQVADRAFMHALLHDEHALLDAMINHECAEWDAEQAHKIAFAAMLKRVIESGKLHRLNGHQLARFVEKVKGRANAVSGDFAKAMLGLMLFHKGLRRHMGADHTQVIMRFMGDPHDLIRLSSQSRWELVAEADHSLNPNAFADYLLNPLLGLAEMTDDAINVVQSFVVSSSFDRLDMASQERFFQRYSSVIGRICPPDSQSQFRLFYNRLRHAAPQYTANLLDGAIGLGSSARCYVSRTLKLEQIGLFVKLLQPQLTGLQSSSRIMHYQVRRAIPVLQLLINLLSRIEPIFCPDGSFVLKRDDRESLLAALQRLDRVKQGPVLKVLLQSLSELVMRSKRLNDVFELGSVGVAGVARAPLYALSIATQNKAALRMLRKRGYEHFKRACALGSPGQSSVKVFTAGSIDDRALPALLMGLDRRSGYTMSHKQCAYTKHRVIVSNSSMYRDGNPDIPLSVVSAVAPNLARGSRFGNVSDLEFYVSGSKLNEQAYYRAMKVAWSLSFHALSVQAHEQDKQMVVVSPLLGGGAYLQGHSDSVREAALRLHMRAMIEAYNAVDHSRLPEVHLCLPEPASASDFDAFAAVGRIRGHLPRMKGRLLVSQSDVFESVVETTGEMDASAYCVGMVNPSSDRVPGGGCYKDSNAATYLRRRSRLHARANRPAELNLRPNALEEQVAHVTRFMYEQCASMNPQHVRFRNIHAVDVAVNGAVTTRAGQLTDRYDDASVVEVLAKIKPGLYPEYAHAKRGTLASSPIRRASSFSTQRGVTEVTQRVAGVQVGSECGVAQADECKPTAVEVGRAKAGLRRARSSAALFVTASNELAAKSRVDEGAGVGGLVASGLTAQQRIDTLVRFTEELSCHSSSLFNALSGDKFSVVKKDLSSMCRIGGPGFVAAFARMLQCALKTRGVSLTSSTALAAVKVLNVKYPTLAAVVREVLKIPRGAEISYAHLVDFAARGSLPREAVPGALCSRLTIN